MNDLYAERDNRKAKGIKLSNKSLYKNGRNDLAAFIHLKNTYGILIELIQPAVE